MDTKQPAFLATCLLWRAVRNAGLPPTASGRAVCRYTQPVGFGRPPHLQMRFMGPVSNNS